MTIGRERGRRKRGSGDKKIEKKRIGVFDGEREREGEGERKRGKEGRREGEKERERERVGGSWVQYSAQRSDERWRKKGERRYTHICDRACINHPYDIKFGTAFFGIVL